MRVARIGLTVYFIGCVGHALLRYFANPVVQAHVELSDIEL